MHTYRIESFLSARLFLVPQLVGNRIFFISNMSGKLSLYAMDHGGSVPEPLLPPEFALQNPHLIGGESFHVFAKLGKILVLLDNDGDENYHPMWVPVEGGYPVNALNEDYADFRFFLGGCDPEHDLYYLAASSHKEALNIAYQVKASTGEMTNMFESKYGGFPDGKNKDHSKAIINEGYTAGDHVIYLWEKDKVPKRLYGTPLENRQPGQDYPINGIHSAHFIRDEQGIIFHTTLKEDTGGLGYLNLDAPDEIEYIEIKGVHHEGLGEFNGLSEVAGNIYLAHYNIDGCDWVYEGDFDEKDLVFNINRVLVGQGDLSNGVLEHIEHEKESGNFALSFSTATSPTQIYTIEGKERSTCVKHTREKLLGLPLDLLSGGEDASYTSFDGLRMSARLYMPADSLGFDGPRPLVYYIHGGPQGQERPDFAWFSMPLIQFLTLNGFAVFVPNVRGSTGYGMSFMKKVDRDWGGDDRLDHVHAMTKVLPKDPRIDTTRAAVVGRSYGGYMTLTLAARHPELWSASCDMFGPYDLFTFMDRLPETWRPYFHLSVGHPDTDAVFLTERSPKTHIENIGAPMLVIQGKNDPRVVEQESRDLVNYLNSIGKEVEYLMFENEGHDVLKFENRVKCYNAITDFFTKHLMN